ncbi:MAG: hypothetical protein ACREN5_12295, partial [Gemmatimonadales bacterium]
VDPTVCPDASLDKEAPATSLRFSPQAGLADGTLYINGPVSVGFQAQDQGPADCRDLAIQETRYRLDGGLFVAGLSVPVEDGGTHTLEYYSVDSKKNAEPQRTVRIVVDKAKPSIKSVRVEPDALRVEAVVEEAHPREVRAQALRGKAVVQDIPLLLVGKDAQGMPVYMGNFRDLDPGRYLVQVSAADQAGNQAQPVAQSMQVGSASQLAANLGLALAALAVVGIGMVLLFRRRAA